MSWRRGIDRQETMLLPERVDDYVTAQNPVRVIDAFVEGLNLCELGLGPRRGNELGAPAYDPKVLIKLYIYGFLNRTRSSRELEKATKRNLEVIWLLGKLQPDHWTINEFRKVHGEKFKTIFRQFNLLCGKMQLFGAELIAIDSSFFKAVNNPARTFTQNNLAKAIEESDKQTELYLRQLEASDKINGSSGLSENKQLQEKLATLAAERKQIEGLLKAAQESPTGQVSLTDPDSRLLKKSSECVVGYNVQIAVDEKHKLIVTNETLLTGGDSGQTHSMAVKVRDELQVEKITIVGDGGYFNIDQLKACEEDGIEVHVPIPKSPQAGDGTFTTEDFKSGPGDVLLCPAGKELTRHADTILDGNVYKVYYNTQACRGCPLLKRCTKGKYRKVKLHVDNEVVERLRQRLEKQPEKLRMRSRIVEHPFGSIKFWMGCRALLSKGLVKVSAEINLSCLAYNMRRVLNIVGVKKLLEIFKAGATPQSLPLPL